MQRNSRMSKANSLEGRARARRTNMNVDEGPGGGVPGGGSMTTDIGVVTAWDQQPPPPPPGWAQKQKKNQSNSLDFLFFNQKAHTNIIYE